MKKSFFEKYIGIIIFVILFYVAIIAIAWVIRYFDATPILEWVGGLGGHVKNGFDSVVK